MILFLMRFGDSSALPVLGETSKTELTPKNLNSQRFSAVTCTSPLF